MSTTDFTRKLSSDITDLNARNARRISRVDAGVSVLFALALGIGGGLLIVFELGGWPW